MIKIVSGEAKGRKLKVPRARGIRPTSNLVRASIFDSLGDRVAGSSALDLFCGSGALGIEALSRGASSCVFVDRDRICTATARENVKVAKMHDRARFITYPVGTALRLLARRNERFDMIFMDPPYQRDLARKTLRALCAYGILTRMAEVVVEHHRKETIGDRIDTLALRKELRHGETVVSFYARSTEE